jgi:hypothetical protein
MEREVNYVVHLSLSRDRWIQSTPYHRISLKSVLVLSSHLRLGLGVSSGLFVSFIKSIQ